MFSKDFHQFLFYQVAILLQSCYCLTGICIRIGLSSCYYNHQISSDHLTTRSCCSVPSEIFRTSYYQKLLLRSVRSLQNILLPEITTAHHQILLYYSMLLHFNHYYLVISMDIFDHGFSTGI